MNLIKHFGGITTIIIIILLAAGGLVFWYFDTLKVEEARATLFEQQKTRQVEITDNVARNIGSSLSHIQGKLEVLAYSEPFQNGAFSSDESYALLKDIDDQLRQNFDIDTVSIIDADGKIANLSNEQYFSAIGQDRSEREFVQQTAATRLPYFSNGYTGAITGEFDIAVTYPIINRDTGQYLGLVTTILNTETFFPKYANIEDLNDQYLSVLDRNGVFLATPSKQYLGVSVFDEKYRQAFPSAESLHSQLFNGSKVTSVVGVVDRTTEDNERLVVGQPIVIDGKAQYYAKVSLPTEVIYSKIGGSLTFERVAAFSILVIVGASIALFTVTRLNKSLDRQVREKTQQLQNALAELTDVNKQLEEKNQQLVNSNEQLQLHDKLQREFVNVAAHELRTPIQPLLGMADLMQYQFTDDKQEIQLTKPEFEMIIRNVNRLERLSQDILEVAHIENQTLKIKKERFDLVEKLNQIVRDVEAAIPQEKKNSLSIKLLTQFKDLEVEADKTKIFEVMANLLSNAIKFTESGTITVSIGKDSNNYAIVKVADTGIGIDQEIMPRLFARFASKSDSGTGLGLYITKSIIDAHGGKIWAENNSDGKGATFYFSLPPFISTSTTAAENNDIHS